MICQDMSEVGTKRKTKYYAVGSCVIKSNLSLQRLSWMCNDDAIRDLHNASKEFLNFMIGFKSAILAIFQFWQNGTFEPVFKVSEVWTLLKLSGSDYKNPTLTNFSSSYTQHKTPFPISDIKIDVERLWLDYPAGGSNILFAIQFLNKIVRCTYLLMLVSQNRPGSKMVQIVKAFHIPFCKFSKYVPNKTTNILFFLISKVYVSKSLDQDKLILTWACFFSRKEGARCYFCIFRDLGDCLMLLCYAM